MFVYLFLFVFTEPNIPAVYVHHEVLLLFTNVGNTCRTQPQEIKNIDMDLNCEHNVENQGFLIENKYPICCN